MEEPPSSSDGLQPQDLSSARGLPNIFDLTRSRDECLLKASPIDALRVVQGPGWFVNPGTSNGSILPESDPLPTDQIPADEAFSNTAVMLSYLSRSHVFSEHSPVYGVPSAFLRAYDPGKLAEDGALVEQQIPVGLTACEPFGFMSPAQVVENMAAFCYLQQPPNMENLALETLKSLQADPSECRFPISVDELQNANALWNVGPFEGGFPEDNGTDPEGLCPNANPELVFLVSRSEEPDALPNEPLNQDFISPGSPLVENEAVDAKQEKEESDLLTGTDPEGLCPNANPELVFLLSRSEEPDALPNEPLNQDFISPGSPLVEQAENEAVDPKQEKESDLPTGTDPEGLCPNANPELVFLISRSEEPDALPNEPLNQDFISPGSPLVEQAENEAVDPKQEESDLPTGTDPEGLCPNANPELVFLISRSEEPDALPNELLNQDFISPGSPLVENEGVDAKLEEEEESDLPTESPDGERDPEGLCPNANPELVFLISRSEEPVALPNEPLNQDFISPGSPLVENEGVDAKLEEEEESDLPTESPDGERDPEGLCPNANPELVFLISRSEEPVALPNEPLNQDFISPGSPLVENEGVDAKLEEEEESDLPTESPDGERDPEGLCPNANPELVFLISRSEEPVALPNEPLNQDFISPGSPLVEQAENEAVDAKSDLPTESPKPTNDPSAVQTDTETSDGLSSLSTKKTLERRKLPPRVLRGTRAIIQSIQPVRSRLTKSQANKNKSSILPDVFEEKKREEAEIRRSKRRKATRSTSSPPNPQRKRTHHSSPISRSATPHKRPKKSHASKRKKHTSFFPPQEPEIKLKCLNWKEEKKEVRDEAFSPYVRVHLKDFPSCKVVNYPESKRGNRPPCSGVVSGVMPATPGLRFGRASADGTRQELLVCCLCGGSSNAMDLGDLHGPYFPEGYKTASKVASNPEQEENSDSCGSWTNSFHRLAESSSDWFSPPVVPLDAGEHWLHQDCGVWAAGVFLVRGKLYGLDEAIRLAKVSVCSTCQKRGATLGCVFKGCPNKFHYMCAVQSGCVLNEENFSIKCRKHKSRSIKGSSCGQINR